MVNPLKKLSFKIFLFSYAIAGISCGLLALIKEYCSEWIFLSVFIGVVSMVSVLVGLSGWTWYFEKYWFFGSKRTAIGIAGRKR